MLAACFSGLLMLHGFRLITHHLTNSKLFHIHVNFLCKPKSKELCFAIFLACASGFIDPVTPLGCKLVPSSETRLVLENQGIDVNPGFCMKQCYSESTKGYIALDMNSQRGPDWGYCTCLYGVQINALESRTNCSETCGGADEVFPGYMCGSKIPYIDTVYGDPGGKVGPEL